MTQRQINQESPLPPCRAGHKARHMLDCRRLESGGGHFVECACGHTQKHARFDEALTEWRRSNGIRAPRHPRPTRSNVVQMGLRLTGGAGR